MTKTFPITANLPKGFMACGHHQGNLVAGARCSFCAMRNSYREEILSLRKRLGIEVNSKPGLMQKTVKYRKFEELFGKTARENLSGWDQAIKDAKRKIAELRYSIKVFSERKRNGEPWPEATQKDTP